MTKAPSSFTLYSYHTKRTYNYLRGLQKHCSVGDVHFGNTYNVYVNVFYFLSRPSLVLQQPYKQVVFSCL